MLEGSALDEIACQRTDFNDNTLDDNSLSIRCPLDNGRVTGQARQSLGLLDSLPLEILHLVLIDIDLRTLTTFRSVNRRALSILDQLYEYRAIVTHCPNLLRGVLSVQSDQWVTCRTLYNTLCQAECEKCGDVGGYVFVLTGNRVCFLCFTTDRAYLPVPFDTATYLFGIPPTAMESIPHMLRLPGKYSLIGRTYPGSQRLVDFRSLHQMVATSSIPSGIQVWNEFYGQTHPIDQVVQWQTSVPVVDVQRRSFVDSKGRNPLRFVAIVQAPFLDPSAQTTYWGFFCVLCMKEHAERAPLLRQRKIRPPLDYRRRFVKPSFEDHLRQCHGISVSQDSGSYQAHAVALDQMT